MAKRYFEYKDAKSKKFWEVSVSGKKVNIRYGKIGTDGQTSLKELGTPAEAKAHAEKQAAGKVKKGYKEAKVKVVKKTAKKAVKKKVAKKAAKKKATKKEEKVMEFSLIRDICGKAMEASKVANLQTCVSDIGSAMGMDDIHKQKDHEYKNNYRFQKAVDYWSDAQLLLPCVDMDELLETIGSTETDIGTYLENIIDEEDEYESVKDYAAKVFNNDISKMKLDLIGGYCFENILEEISAVESGEGDS